MAEMLVDSTKLDACLDAEADAIRAKTGGTSPIPYDFANNKGFADAIAAIPTGGGADMLPVMLQGAETFDFINDGITTIIRNGLSWSKVRDVRIPNCTSCGVASFSFSSIRSLFAPKAMVQSTALSDCGSVISAVIHDTYSGTDQFRRSPLFEILDVLVASQFGIGSSFFQNDTNFATLIVRDNKVWSLSSVSAFTGTKFADGGAGGTLYVPQAQIANYQAATNWSTILSYPNNQILPIEGSIYETQYADGTLIPSE